LCSKAPSPASQWQGENINNFAWRPRRASCQADLTADLEERGIARELNMMVENGGMIPLVHRGRISARIIQRWVAVNVWDSGYGIPAGTGSETDLKRKARLTLGRRGIRRIKCSHTQ
jgi:hypothetical protein